jgi:PAS domain-containing protein
VRGPKDSQPPGDLKLVTIPSSDHAFKAHVEGLARDAAQGPAGLERRLRRIFPRVVVRERELSSEPTVWYVYRDGRWQAPASQPWWEEDALPRIVLTGEGWLVDISPTAAGLLGIDAAETEEHHFTDFIVPGTLQDALALFKLVERGSPLTATILLQPASGEVIAVDLHVARSGDDVAAVLRLASDLDIAVEGATVPRPTTVTTRPPTDVAYRAYVLRALGRMPEPTLDGLALRLRRLYPHAIVHGDGETWVAEREPGAAEATRGWWGDLGLPRVRYDAEALILEANEAAERFLGRALVGRHWQDFVTPGSTEEVAVMLEILGEVGAAESRFRLPRSDGNLVEFDSYTTVTGEEFVTVMKPVGAEGFSVPRAQARPVSR